MASRQVLHLSHAARRHLESLSQHIVFAVKSGGCAGLEYVWDTTDVPSKDSLCLDNGYTVSICPKSLLFVLGTRVDYTTDMFGQRFTYDNPNASQGCGCNLSFSPSE